jgi:excisionase family DNA binding protein
MSEPDFSTWFTKQQAADAIGVSTKTIEKFAADKKIQQGAWRPHGRGAEKAVYNPDDVARIAQERHRGLAPFVLPAGTDLPAKGNGHRGARGLAIAAASSPSGEEVIRLVFTAALRTLTSERRATSENSEKSHPALFMTIAEAAVVSGLPQADIRRAIDAGELKARKTGRGGWRIRRKDLEQLS